MPEIYKKNHAEEGRKKKEEHFSFNQQLRILYVISQSFGHLIKTLNDADICCQMLAPREKLSLFPVKLGMDYIPSNSLVTSSYLRPKHMFADQKHFEKCHYENN